MIHLTPIYKFCIIPDLDCGATALKNHININVLTALRDFLGNIEFLSLHVYTHHSQVLVWKTNFDVIDNREVLRSQRKRPTTTTQPHTHDPPPQSHVTSRGHAHELDANRVPLDHVTRPPNVVNVGPQLFHKPHPQLQEDNEDEWTIPPAFPLDQKGDNGEVPIPPSSRSHDQRMGGSHSQTTPLEQMTMPPQLANTLEHIVGQLDILTQVGCSLIWYSFP